MFVRGFECVECGEGRPWGGLPSVCRACGGPLAVRYDLAAVGRATEPREIGARPRGLWRWRELLPLPDGARPVSLGEGDTPLLELPALAAELGLDGGRVLLLDESRNPTGSFKARGMSVAVSAARALGARGFAVPSAGNAAGALAAYGARARLPVRVAMPADAPRVNRLEVELAGAELLLVPGTISDCARALAQEAPGPGWYDLSTMREPFRLEGKKTMGYEIAEGLGYRLPDWILYPTGGGTGLLGFWKAFAELSELGWLAREIALPRMVAVQAAGCAPLVRAFEEGAAEVVPPDRPATLAGGLRVPRPFADRWLLRVLAESGGRACAVSDDDILAATRSLARLEGIWPAPEAGAAVAALRQLCRAGHIERGATVVLVNTGAGLKAPEVHARPGSEAAREA